MDSCAIRIGDGRLVSYSPVRELPWRVVFEDEGAAGYWYACDGRRATVHEDFDVTVMDAMLVYNVDAIRNASGLNVDALPDPVPVDKEPTRLLTVEWSRDGQRAALRLDGVPQVLIDFQARESYCRSNFPNFVDDGRNQWRSTDHSWNEQAMRQFEADSLA